MPGATTRTVHPDSGTPSRRFACISRSLRTTIGRRTPSIARVTASAALLVGIATTASAQPLNSGVWTRVGAANIENRTNQSVGGLFNGNCNLSSSCTYGPDANGDFWNPFTPAAGAKILFITRDRTYWAEALFSTVSAITTAATGDGNPNIQWTSAGRNGVDLGSAIVGNILMRPNNAFLEDPWVTLQGAHSFSLSNEMLWGENNFNNANSRHYELMFNRGGLDVFISSPATVPEPSSVGLVALGLVGVAAIRRRKHNTAPAP